MTWLSLLLTSCGTPATRAVASATLAPATATPGLGAPPPAGNGAGITSCVRELTHDTGRHLLVVIGASFTAGVGSGSANRSWAVVLARALHWNAVVYGVSGAGYVWPGAGLQGPVSAEIDRIDLRALNPSLIIVQAGHDDMRVPADVESQHVTETIDQLRTDAPRAKIALLTVFRGHALLSRALLTDQTIVSAATAADPNVIIMDPLVGNWQYQRARDGLHPTVAGSEWLAREVGEVLNGRGVQPAPQPTIGPRHHGRTPPIMCDYSAVGKHRRIRVPPPPGVSARIQPS